MERDEYRRMYEAERTHFWFRGTRAIVFDQVRSLADRVVSVLDVGCGTGGTLSQMPSNWTATGVDYSPEALGFARSRGHVRLVQATATDLPVASARFDLAFALDVIEHCDDDLAVVRELRRILRPEGTLVATVPAFQFLFGPHDVALAHRRRYRRARFGGLLQEAGFEIEKLSYFNTVLFAPSAAVRVAAKLAGIRDVNKSDAGQLPRPLNELLFRIFASERSILRSWNMPIGLSILAVARRL
jgi:SAM-dependent methyltransferase